MLTAKLMSIGSLPGRPNKATGVADHDEDDDDDVSQGGKNMSANYGSKHSIQNLNASSVWYCFVVYSYTCKHIFLYVNFLCYATA